MKKTLSMLTLSLASFTFIAKAQTDTTKHQLGRIALSKKFTQAVTVKGTDLEKQPFVTLREAVNSWFYGAYGISTNYVTVVDGNLLTDINAYSVFDIEEVTMVQNSLTHLNGISPFQILLLVKTKRGNRTSSSGVDVAAQTNFVDVRNLGTDGKSTNNMYHQYYVSPYVNNDKLKAGVSASFQRNVWAGMELGGNRANRPLALSRLRLNGYADLKLGDNTTLSVSAGYTPQTDTARYQTGGTGFENHYGLHRSHDLWYGQAKLFTKISSKLSNNLSVGMQHYKRNSFNNIVSSGIYNSFSSTDTTSNIKQYLISDDITYTAKAGRWLFEPNVNFSYRWFKNDITGVNKAPLNEFRGEYRFSERAAFLTPSLAISLDKALMIQVGAQYYLNTVGEKSHDRARFLPFASLTVNILRSDLSDNPNTAWNIYTSYAKTTNNMGDPIGSLSSGDRGYWGPGRINGVPVLNLSSDLYSAVHQYQAGTTLALLKNKINISYNYSANNFAAAYGTYIPMPESASAYAVLYQDITQHIHRLSFDIRAVQTNSFSWITGLNGTLIKRDQVATAGSAILFDTDPYNLGNPVTGGFVNRLAYKKFSAGLDVLYRINRETYSASAFSGLPQKRKVNSFDLKNVYLGYQPSVSWAKGAEVFVNARNVVQNKTSDLGEDRRYYGFGVKFSL
ncbi:hypothetical protein [Mucilaginibacter myungsuensis]|uniref:TonB-dependent receptor n=1 Tax=Mucilaginibacter myungsuensis TaxID=649104 RepID=A0A929PZ17_9SPHI|nr:hypothetical protein [Mucilaginibacter myungsuensis]MBE9664040.1 hypothetical protein [Mucilaginibacter myungsuensis]MDN3601219.1 hypothetical protein [Mucilaginibacter myungsuensis]